MTVEVGESFGHRRLSSDACIEESRQQRDAVRINLNEIDPPPSTLFTVALPLSYEYINILNPLFLPSWAGIDLGEIIILVIRLSSIRYPYLHYYVKQF